MTTANSILALTSWDDNGSLQIFTGNGDGTFTVGTLYKFNAWVQCYPSGGTNPYWISAGDLNQDGKLDLAIAVNYTACGTEYSGQQNWGAALVYTGNGDGTFNLGRLGHGSAAWTTPALPWETSTATACSTWP